MRVAWRCNVAPAVFVTVAAESHDVALDVASKRIDVRLRSYCTATRRPEMDELAGSCDGDRVLEIEEY